MLGLLLGNRRRPSVIIGVTPLGHGKLLYLGLRVAATVHARADFFDRRERLREDLDLHRLQVVLQRPDVGLLRVLLFPFFCLLVHRPYSFSFSFSLPLAVPTGAIFRGMSVLATGKAQALEAAFALAPALRAISGEVPWLATVVARKGPFGLPLALRGVVDALVLVRLLATHLADFYR